MTPAPPEPVLPEQARQGGGERRLPRLTHAIDPGGLSEVRPPAPLWDAILGALAIAIFTLDLYAPHDVTAAVFYPLLVILTAVWSGSARIVAVALATIVLTLVGWEYADLSLAPTFNRSYALLAILVAAWVSLRLDRSREALRSSLGTLAFELLEREKMERLVHESERRYRYLFRNASDIFLVVDAFTHRIVDFNRMAMESYGYDEEQLSQLRLEDLLDAAGRPAQMEQFEAARVGRHVSLGEVHHVRKGGARFPVSPQATALRLGERELVFLILRDLSDYQQVQIFQSLLLTCSICGAVRDDAGGPQGQGEWVEAEVFLERRSNANLAPAVCPACCAKYGGRTEVPQTLHRPEHPPAS